MNFCFVSSVWVYFLLKVMLKQCLKRKECYALSPIRFLMDILNWVTLLYIISKIQILSGSSRNYTILLRMETMDTVVL